MIHFLIIESVFGGRKTFGEMIVEKNVINIVKFNNFSDNVKYVLFEVLRTVLRCISLFSKLSYRKLATIV